MLPPTHPSLLAELKQSGTRQAAFEHFCRLYRPGLVARCRGCGLQPSDAEDITQVILLRLWEALRGFTYDPEKGSFRGYLTRVVGNAVADHFRDRQRHPQPEAARVRARVDARTWECFVMREVERLPVEDVLKATGKREGAVYQVVYRLRKQISEEYQRVLRERGQAPEGQQP
jgi:RNA polymerase sigma-70 factor (ECF subfamily)